MSRRTWAWDLLAYIGALNLLLVVLGSLNVLDFHVCIKGAGHCKIIDPSKGEGATDHFRGVTKMVGEVRVAEGKGENS